MDPLRSGHSICWLTSVAVVLIVCGAVRAGGEASEPRINFSRQIEPILSENCFACHGPDDKQRKAKLRLDSKEGALAHQSVIKPGQANASELIQRVTASDPAERMPPPKSGKRLSSQQIELLRQWIDQGAVWSRHWSFVPPVRPTMPVLRKRDWARNPIDYFIAARLQHEGLHPAVEADRTTLLRRLTLDLTGLPPTPAEIDAYAADPSSNAYEKQVDRLLASPRYGERMALDWLDAARYADTHGYHIDSGRDMSRWREWVIDAFNRNQPFDRFTIEQLAGDLLPEPTIEQRVASGFNRNHMINFEGGAIPEEYHTAYIVDRVNTTATVWLGLTIGCAQCHDHKFDPISQKEYYQLFAFFHNVPENGLDGSKGNAAPVLAVPTSGQQRRLQELAASIKEVEQRMAQPMPGLAKAQADWEQSLAAAKPTQWTVLDPTEVRSQGGATLAKLPDLSVLASGSNPPTDTYTVTATVALENLAALRVEALPDDSLPAKGPGRAFNGNLVLTDVRVRAGPAESRGAKPVKLKTASADYSQPNYPVALAIDDNAQTGWAIHPAVGKPHAAVFEFDQIVQGKGKLLLQVTLDFQSSSPQHQLGRFRLAVTQAQGVEQLPPKFREIIAIPPSQRSDRQKAHLHDYYRLNVSPEGKGLAERLAQLQQNKKDLENKLPTTMVMQEMPEPRSTYLLVRGQYDKHGEKVSAGVPAQLSPLPSGAPHNRLGLARWLVDQEQPLTARVIVNRYWQMYFGTGLVKTAEDFGAQGERPSHPELLDWLAAEFRDSGWDVKHMQRLMVTSATYRQSSAVNPQEYAKDPENRLLARGPRVRLPAEFIRDQALMISGLLDGRMGGVSVSPYQPPGLWEELASRLDGANWTAQVYRQSHGHDLYRRTMYTFWKRTSPPPTLATFDAPDRETCTVRRARTNTPLQALILMNDPTYVEASRKLAERLMKEATAAPERINLAFRLAVARPPTAKELAVLQGVFQTQREAFRRDQAAALKILTIGESKKDEQLDPVELAAWTTVANVILNLDETITKG
jgi:hypothetical protein